MKGFKGKIKKKITLKLIGDAEKSFNDLNRIVGEQRSQGITSSKDFTHWKVMRLRLLLLFLI